MPVGGIVRALPRRGGFGVVVLLGHNMGDLGPMVRVKPISSAHHVLSIRLESDAAVIITESTKQALASSVQEWLDDKPKPLQSFETLI